MKPELIKVLGLKDDHIKVLIKLFGQYEVEGIYFHTTGKLFICAESFAQSIEKKSFIDLLKSDFWTDIFNEVELIKHESLGWIFYVN